MEESRCLLFAPIKEEFWGWDGSVKYGVFLADAFVGSHWFGSLISGSKGCWFSFVFSVANAQPTAFDGQTMVESFGDNDLGTALNRFGVKHWLFVSSFTRRITMPQFWLSASLFFKSIYSELFADPRTDILLGLGTHGSSNGLLFFEELWILPIVVSRTATGDSSLGWTVASDKSLR